MVTLLSRNLKINTLFCYPPASPQQKATMTLLLRYVPAPLYLETPTYLVLFGYDLISYATQVVLMKQFGKLHSTEMQGPPCYHKT